MQPFLIALALLAVTIPVASAGAKRSIDFTLENITNGITYRPFLVAAHAQDKPVFSVGADATSPAMAGIQLMAECGGLGPAPFPNLVDRLSADGADFVANPVDIVKPFDPPLGLLFPAGITAGDTLVPFDAGLAGSVSGTLVIDDNANRYLSVVAMLLPTNDAFVGLDSWPIPATPGTHILYLPAYDAGTETNNEIMSDDNPLDCVPNEPGFPVDPLGNTGTGGSGLAQADVSPRIHIHRNQLGDLDSVGGPGDLDSRIHRWQNPVVKMTVTIRPGTGNGR